MPEDERAGHTQKAESAKQTTNKNQTHKTPTAHVTDLFTPTRQIDHHVPHSAGHTHTREREYNPSPVSSKQSFEEENANS